MSFEILFGDITKLHVDAIVNAANATLLGGGGVDGAIHRAAGKALTEVCKTLGGCATAEANITGGYNLPAKYVIHTVGPIYRGGIYGEADALRNCYINCMALAKEYGIKTIAFPVLSAGAYGYPKEEALDILINTVSDEIRNTDITAYMVLYDRELVHICSEKYPHMGIKVL